MHSGDFHVTSGLVAVTFALLWQTQMKCDTYSHQAWQLLCALLCPAGDSWEGTLVTASISGPPSTWDVLCQCFLLGDTGINLKCFPEVIMTFKELKACTYCLRNCLSSSSMTCQGSCVSLKQKLMIENIKLERRRSGFQHFLAVYSLSASLLWETRMIRGFCGCRTKCRPWLGHL